MVTKTCDRCGELIMPPDPWTQATTRLSVVVSDPRALASYALDLCYDCQREVFFCAKPDGTWFNGVGAERRDKTDA